MATKLIGTAVAVMLFFLICPTSNAFRITRAVSDLHFASVWFNDSTSHSLMRKFFTELADTGAAEGVTELVLIGDIIELWLDPFDTYPPTVEQVLGFELAFGANVSSYFEQMRNVSASGIQLVALPGNHDFELTEAALRTQLPDIIWVDRAYISDYARYEHSHYYDLFNAPPPDPKPRRPLGYYVARCVATGAYARGGSPTYSSTVQVCQNVNLGILTDPAIKTVSNEKLFKQMIPVLFNTALGTDWTNYKDVPIKGGDPYYDTTKDTTLSQVVDRYASLVSDFAEHNTSDEGSCGAFDYFIQSRFPEDVVVMGHTHEPLADMFFRKGADAERLSPQIAYINSGAWVTNGSFTYVDTVYDYHPECTHPTQLIQYEFTHAGAIQRKTLWLYSPDFGQVIRNTGEESRNSLKFRCGKPVSCPRSGQCDGGLNRANLITLAILSAGGVLLEGDARGIEWLGKRYFTTLGNLSIDLSDRIYYEAENGTTSILFLAQWWSDQGSQLGQIAVLPFDPCPIPTNDENTYLGSLTLNPSIAVAVVIGVVGFAVVVVITFVFYWFAVKPHTTPLP